MRRPRHASFIGLDLAWSDRNPSGVAHLVLRGKGCVLLGTDHLSSDEEIVTWMEERSGRTSWVGIDAPMIAPNPPKTTRPVDRMVSSRFGRFHAGVYPGNRERCARPIRLSKKLAAKGFSPDPYLPSPWGRRQLEIFPHLVQVGLFGRKRIIKYKKGSGDQKRKGLRILQHAVGKNLAGQIPPLLPSQPLRKLLDESPRGLRGRGLKGLEDRIDALMCAYMTFYFWYWRERRCEILGDLMTGYIIGPRQR